ncbi:hypothetical protein [Arthrobacter sp. Br18]|uniref:hypothetical protein n=1 Tax=Arthrobacter sp. Br18 TaxID=1312954 RepID=UPI0004B336EB|nr:hypothetical protein [Arthrobacter sp. Br18]
MSTYTAADLAAAWNSGYWHGLDHTGPVNDAAINARNPYTHDNEAAAQAPIDDGGGDSD